MEDNEQKGHVAIKASNVSKKRGGRIQNVVNRSFLG